MATPEGKVKRRIDKWLADNLPLVYVYKPPGGAFGKAGEPDYHICWRGIFIAIEAKREGGQASALQLSRLRRIQRAGGIAALVKGVDEIFAKLPYIRQLALERTPSYVYPVTIPLADARGAGPVPASEDHDGVSASE